LALDLIPIAFVFTYWFDNRLPSDVTVVDASTITGQDLSKIDMRALGDALWHLHQPKTRRADRMAVLIAASATASVRGAKRAREQEEKKEAQAQVKKVAEIVAEKERNVKWVKKEQAEEKKDEKKVEEERVKKREVEEVVRTCEIVKRGEKKKK
jgi:hypothetical protein